MDQAVGHFQFYEDAMKMIFVSLALRNSQDLAKRTNTKYVITVGKVNFKSD